MFRFKSEKAAGYRKNGAVYEIDIVGLDDEEEARVIKNFIKDFSVNRRIFADICGKMPVRDKEAVIRMKANPRDRFVEKMEISTEKLVMAYQIDELLKISKYDIYNNPDIDNEEIKRIAEIISTDKNIDLKEYFQLLKCSSKFCWFNYLKILETLPEEDRIRGIPVLFELLQDSNWPTYQKTVELLEAMDKKMIQSCLDKYLEQAYEEGDEMWIF